MFGFLLNFLVNLVNFPSKSPHVLPFSILKEDALHTSKTFLPVVDLVGVTIGPGQVRIHNVLSLWGSIFPRYPI